MKKSFENITFNTKERHKLIFVLDKTLKGIQQGVRFTTEGFFFHQGLRSIFGALLCQLINNKKENVNIESINLKCS